MKPEDTKKQPTAAEIEAWLIAQISGRSGRAPDDIDIRESFVYHGLNSKQLVSMTGDLGIWLRRSLPSTLGFDYPNIEAIALHLAGEDLIQSTPGDIQAVPRAITCQQVKHALTEQPSSQKKDRMDSMPIHSNFIGSEQLQKAPLRQMREPIAIIGMGCRFPGGCNDPETFWHFLREGGDAITEVPSDRWNADALYDPNPDAPGKMYTRWGGFLDNLDRFDATFFGISPREAIGMDPQQRLVMEVSWEALENAGEAPDKLAGSQTGVFIGISGSDYGRLLFKDSAHLNLYSGTGSSTSIVANRVSYFLGLRGPSIAVDTACSSSLVSVHLACQSLRSGECSLALAGGVNLILSPEMTIIFSKARLMAPDGRCKTFDATADGYVRSEGCGIVVLKRYSDAIRDGDNILALLLGTAVNQDGQSNGLTVPNGLAQRTVIREALANAGVEPSHVSYVEAHGTGTSVGDPIEVQALGAVLSKGRSDDHSLIIGSVKTNIGHLEQAAGIAGLIKVVLSFQHEEIPPHLHFKKINPFIFLEQIPATIPTEQVPWHSGEGQRIAGVSAFSFGGTNAHMILEEAPALHPTDNDIERPLHIMTLSAQSENALKELARRYETFLEAHPDALLGDVCFTANVGRAHFPYRLAVAVESTKQLRDRIGAFAAGSRPTGLVSGHVQKGSHPKVAFLFTGQGSQYVGMGQQLYYTQPTFRKALDRCAEILKSHIDRPLLSVIFEEEGDSSVLNETAYTQPALFALEYALSEMWRSWRIEPSVVMGHSVGEYVAACVAGVFSLEDGLKLIAARGRLIQALPQEGEMAAIFAGEERVALAVAPYANDVSIAAINGPENVVITGVRKSVRKILDDLASEGIRAVQLKVSHAFHSPLMEPMLSPFEEVAAEVDYSAPRIGLISNVTGQPVENKEVCEASYWGCHVREPVRFSSGIITLYEKGYRLFVEIGPSPVLSGMGSNCLPEAEAIWLPCLRRGRSDWKQVMESLGELYVRGVDVDWSGFDRDYSRRRLSLPTYPFERKHYWIEAAEDRQIKDIAVLQKDRPGKAVHSLQGYRLYTPLKEIIFEYQCATDSYFLKDYQLYGIAMAPTSFYLTIIMAAGEEGLNKKIYGVQNMIIQEPLCIPEDKTRTVQLIFTHRDSGEVPFQIFSKQPEGNKQQAPWMLHATGKLHIEQREKPVSYLEKVSFEEIKARCREEIPGSEYYQRIKNHGLEIGNHFKWIKKIWQGDGEVLAQMRLPTPEEEFENYQIHPGIVDSCSQLLFACLPLKTNSTYVFLGYDSYRFYGGAEDRLWCHLILRTENTEQEVISGYYCLFNKSGQVVAEVVGMHAKGVSCEELMSIGGEHGKTIQVEDDRSSVERSELLRRIANASPGEGNDLVIGHIRDHVVEVLWLEPTKSLDLQRPLMELGLDSLMVIELRNRLRANLGVDLPLTDFLHSPTIVQLAELVLGQLAESPSLDFPSTPLPQIAPAPDQKYLPFPLTDVQHAYWIGSRSGTFELGNVSCHVYIEVEMLGLDPERLNLALLGLIERHDMLRAIVLPDGQQQILEHVPPYKIEVLDLSRQDPDVAAFQLEAVRQRMSHHVLPADQWPLFEIRASLLNNQRTRLHISFDLLIGDAWSFMILIRELYLLYRNPEASLSSLDLSFRDYVLAERNFQNSELYRRSMDYWRGRLATLPPAPDLPLARNSGTVKFPRFSRRKARLEQETWFRLKTRAARAGLTPSGVLLAAFAEILAIWSKTPHFTINLTLFNRMPLHPQVNEIVGDFTSLILLAVDNSSQDVFEVHARGIQEQLWRDLEHRQVSGVQVLRELRRAQRESSTMTVPVVFTSLLPLSASTQDTSTGFLPEDLPLDVIYCISQTPQVWLDHQVYEQNGTLAFNWDVVEELFHEGLLDDMFDAYCRLLKRLADEEDAWQETTRQLIPAAQLEKRALFNATEAPISSEMLHTLFVAQARRRAKQAAVVSSKRTLSYEELSNRSNQAGRLLQEKGAQPNTLVAVVMEKGWEQVVAVLGILQSGAAYLPIDPELPRERLWHLLEDGEISLVLTQSWLEERLEWPEGIQRFSVDKMDLTDKDARPLASVQKPEDLAYVIYTSGSTGLPKGVMIDHRGAVNTILDANKRFGIGPEDRVLALANLNFDLSVYDIFGTLAAGGTIVLPEADKTKDPAHWLELMAREQVTVWNSVPTLMQMLLEYASGRKDVVSQSLRLVLLSGDWIPLDLPDQIKALVDGVQVISLGGATEASIWSNLYPIGEVNPQWKSIPYGRPMVNQRFYVLNGFLEDCPDWVAGQLHIGGIGLAKGYWRDEEKTRDSFIIHPRSGERLYRTGDLGRYLPDGNIEFLGREDFQVKIRGYRIELGEIEAALKQHPWVRDAVVTAVGDPQADKRLVGYVVPDQEEPPATDELRGFLREKLPEYMVPSAFVMLDALPLTPNGKVDRKALPMPDEVRSERERTFVAPQTQLEASLAEIWTQVLNINRVGIHDNFFELGGDSLLAIQIISRVYGTFRVELSLQSLFSTSNIADLAKSIGIAMEEKMRDVDSLVSLPQIVPAPDQRYQPFPLTDIQHAYWIGRSGAYDLGNIAAHFYYEIESDHINIERLNLAWQRLIERHEMLRAVILPDGQQHIMEYVPPYQFEVIDLRGKGQEVVAAELEAIRQEMCQQILPADQWPLFEIRAARLDGQRIRVHIDFDNMIADAWSLFIFLREWAELYLNPDAPLSPLELSFRDYVLSEADLRNSDLYQRDQAYWVSRLSNLPPAPDLPLAKNPADLKQPAFVRRNFKLKPEIWLRLKNRASKAGLTPSGILIAVYAEVLSVWSKSPSFTINVTLFNRLPLHTQVNEIVGRSRYAASNAID